LSGPILDRIDLHVRLERCNPDVFFRETKEPCSADIHTRVCKTRAFASKRITTDNNLAEANEQIELSVEAQSFLLDSATSMALSNRGITRTLRVARTIADFDQSEAITRPHIAEALAFRVRTTS
jgi:magnesium chelatase family protein